MLLLFLLIFRISTGTTVTPTCSDSDSTWQLDDGNLLYYNGECCNENCGNLLDFEKSKKAKYVAQVSAVNSEICKMLSESFLRTTTTVGVDVSTLTPLDCGWLGEPLTFQLMDGTVYEYSGECCVPEAVDSVFFEKGVSDEEKRPVLLQVLMIREGLCNGE